MDAEKLREGKRRVDEHLIRPLEQMGMRRKRNLSEADHAAMLDRLRARLAYMDGSRLDALREVVQHWGGGKRRDLWPTEVSILAQAFRLQRPPASDSRLILSYLGSRAGARARDGGYLVELYAYLKRMGRVPDGDKLLRAQSIEARGARAAATRRIEAGRPYPGDPEMIAAYYDQLRHAEALVANGEEVRADA